MWIRVTRPRTDPPRAGHPARPAAHGTVVIGTFRTCGSGTLVRTLATGSMSWMRPPVPLRMTTRPT